MTDSASPLIHRLVLEALPLDICVVNRDTKVILWGAGAEQLTGYLGQDVPGRSCKDNILQYNDAENTAIDSSSTPLLETLREGHGVAEQLSLRTRAGHSGLFACLTVTR
jgi:PAS domain S-box-containing protein